MCLKVNNRLKGVRVSSHPSTFLVFRILAFAGRGCSDLHKNCKNRTKNLLACAGEKARQKQIHSAERSFLYAHLLLHVEFPSNWSREGFFFFFLGAADQRYFHPNEGRMAIAEAGVQGQAKRVSHALGPGDRASSRDF